MMTTIQTFLLQWRGIPITILYNPNFSKASKEIFGESISHIQVKADQPLPITETGYRSIFLSSSEVEKNGTSLFLIEKMLEKAAESPKWKAYVKSRNQLSLF